MSESTEHLPATVNRGGRPSKYCPELVDKICECVRDGIPLVHASTIAGVSVQSVHSYRKEFPEFDGRIKAAISEGIQSRLAVVKKAMASKDESISLRAACWWLSHAPNCEGAFSETRRISGPNGEVPVQIIVAIDSSKI